MYSQFKVPFILLKSLRYIPEHQTNPDTIQIPIFFFSLLLFSFHRNAINIKSKLFVFYKTDNFKTYTQSHTLAFPQVNRLHHTMVMRWHIQNDIPFYWQRAENIRHTLQSRRTKLSGWMCCVANDEVLLYAKGLRK